MSDQHLIGTLLDDVLTGGDGNDWLEGLAGNDTLIGGAGDDRLEGGKGVEPFLFFDDDWLEGLAGNDTLSGGAGNDHLDGGEGDDTFLFANGSDTTWFSEETILGGAGNDVIRFTSTTPDDLLFFWKGPTGIETIVIGDESGDTSGTTALNVNARNVHDGGLTIIGNDGANRIIGTFNADSLFGGGGDDWFAAGGGEDVINGGAGSDTVFIGGVLPWIPGYVDLGAGYSDDGEGVDLLVDIENAEGWDTNDTLIGSAVANRLAGMGGDDTLSGLGGNDILDGGAGNDVLDGGTGNDSMRGGAGDDLYFADSNGDVALENPGDGVDTVVASVNYQLFWEQIENLILVGPNAFGGVGNQGNNTITGNDEDNALFGLGGDDVLIGGAGSDFLVGGEGNDTYEAGFGGQDIIQESGGNDELRIGGGITPDQIQREVLGNDLILRVAGTTDYVTLFNWFFDPSYRIERVVFDDGTIWDAETIVSGAVIIGTEGNDDNLVGTELNDRIEGRGGHDFIQGLGGDDLIDGGEGNDITDGGAGDDTYLFGLGSGGDSLQEWGGSGTDVLQLGPGVAGGDLAFRGIFNDLTITLPGGLDQVTLRDFLSGGFQHAIDVIRFDDGSQAGIVRADGVQTGYNGGDNVDIFFSSAQAETFWGGQGNDFYVQSGPVGALNVDTIQDLADGSGGNQLHFANVMPANPFSHLPPIVDYQLSHRNDGYLEISIEGAEWVRLANFNSQDALGAHAVERYSFMDGSSMSYAQLLERGFDINGGFGFDELHGTNIHDRIRGNEGNDYLFGYGDTDNLFGGAGDDGLDGGDGNDWLEGGEGDDTLLGEDGSDVYYFDRYSGHDWVLELVSLEEGAGDLDAIVFAEDITPEDLIVSLDPLGRFLISIAGSDTSILFNAWFDTDILDSRIELFFFQNFSVVLTDEDITALLNDAPVLANPLGDMAAFDTLAFSFTVPGSTFFDDDPGDTLAYSAALEGGGALPSWLTFNAATHTFAGTPGSANVGDAFNVQVTATDSHGESASDVFMIMVGRAPNQNIVGTPGNDTLAGASGDDTISGLAGNDTLSGGDGNDTLLGGDGTDVLYGGAGNDTLNGGPGQDFLYGEDGDDLMSEASVMDGGAGNDELHADATHDATLHGGAGDDVIYSGAGADFLYGDGGNDTIYGGEGRDEIYGGDGDDRMYEASVIYGGAGNDELHGDATHDDTLYGEDGFDLLWGGSANDQLDGGTGIDAMFGGAGNDRYWIDDVSDVAVESAGMGLDTIHSYVTYSLANFANIENLELLGTAALNALGNASPNTIVGNAGDNVLDGGGGSDNMIGGEGNDTFMVDQSGDNVNDSAGIDTVIASISYTLGSTIENLTLTGSGNLTGNGNASNNVITGNSGNNLIDGRAGSDTLRGLAGNDTYVVDNVGDQVIEAANEGNDTVNSSVSFTLGDNLEILTLTGTANSDGTGNSLNNMLTGNSGANRLSGGAGSDNLSGGDGNDILNGGTGVDTLNGGIGADTFVFDALPGTANADVVQGFGPSDRIQLDDAVMAALGATGNFTANDARFWSSGSGQAHDASDRVIYNTNTGALWYDADGNGSVTAQLIATLQGDPTLVAAQISII